MGLSQISQETVSRKGTKREPETQRQHLEHNKDLLAEAHSLIFPEKAHANPPFLQQHNEDEADENDAAVFKAKGSEKRRWRRDGKRKACAEQQPACIRRRPCCQR
eukprot:478583-Pelagomonas_calceolata.AAC.4